MTEELTPLQAEISRFLRERGYITQRSAEPNSIDVFVKKGPANPTLLGTLNASNPSLLILTTKVSERSGIASTLAAQIAGGLQKSVTLA